MFRKGNNEQNENILCLRDIIRFRIMFTIFKFQKRNQRLIDMKKSLKEQEVIELEV